MMNRNYLFFGIASLLCAGILCLLPVEYERVAAIRLKRVLSTSNIRSEVLSQCDSLDSLQKNRFTEIVAGMVGLSPRVDSVRPCFLWLEATHHESLFLTSRWNVGVRFQSATTTIISQQIQFDFPLPLVVLPLLVFLLALIFEIKEMSLGIMGGVFLLSLSGGNLLLMIRNLPELVIRTLQWEPNWIGFALLAYWVQRVPHRRVPGGRFPLSLGVFDRAISPLFSLLMGLWNPVALVLIGPLSFGVMGNDNRTKGFLDYQILLAGMSMYFLIHSTGGFIGISTVALQLPRYVLYTLVLLLFLRNGFSAMTTQHPILRTPQFILWLGMVLGVEWLVRMFPVVKTFPFLTRVVVCLVVSECLLFGTRRSGEALVKSGKIVWVLLCSLLLTVCVVQSGLLELISVLVEPKRHPSYLSFFCLLAGMGFGFVSGSLAITFLALYLVNSGAVPPPLVEAGFLDGVWLGAFFSPFSLYNVLPGVQAHWTLQRIVRYRFFELSVPLTVGLIIFAIGVLSSVAILRSVTFVFVCQLLLAIFLYRNRWDIRWMRELFSELPQKGSP